VQFVRSEITSHAPSLYFPDQSLGGAAGTGGEDGLGAIQAPSRASDIETADNLKLLADRRSGSTELAPQVRDRSAV